MTEAAAGGQVARSGLVLGSGMVARFCAEGFVMRQRWEIDELIESWTLSDDDRLIVANKTGTTRLG